MNTNNFNFDILIIESPYEYDVAEYPEQAMEELKILTSLCKENNIPVKFRGYDNSKVRQIFLGTDYADWTNPKWSNHNSWLDHLENYLNDKENPRILVTGGSLKIIDKAEFKEDFQYTNRRVKIKLDEICGGKDGDNDKDYAVIGTCIAETARDIYQNFEYTKDSIFVCVDPKSACPDDHQLDKNSLYQVVDAIVEDKFIEGRKRYSIHPLVKKIARDI